MDGLDKRRKYAIMMHEYIIEEINNCADYELRLFVVTALHTGLRVTDVLNLSWDQYKDKIFENVKLHKPINLKEEHFSDVKIRDCEIYKNRIDDIVNEFSVCKDGIMFKTLNKATLSKQIEDTTGIINFSTHMLRTISNYASVDLYNLFYDVMSI